MNSFGCLIILFTSKYADREALSFVFLICIFYVFWLFHTLSLLSFLCELFFVMTHFDSLISFCLIFCSLNLICLGIDILLFILLSVLWSSSICDLVSVINFGKISIIISSDISSVPFSFFSSYPHYILVSPTYITPFVVVSQFLDVVFILSIIFSLCISVLEVFIDILQAHWFFPWLCPVCWTHQEAFFISVPVFFYL